MIRALGVLLAAALASCAKAPPYASSRSRPNDAGLAIDTAVMAYLSMARARHHEANLKEDDDVPGAIAALDALTTAPKPHPSQRVPEIEEVLADTYARKAELEVRAGHFAQGAEDVRQGLAHAPDPTYFRGHLLEVAGLVEEARARDLEDAGHAGEAKAAKARAIDLLQQAVAVEDDVVRASLADGGAVR